MKMTDALKKWLVGAGLAAADASEDELKEATAKAMVDGKLTADQFAELTTDPDAAKAAELNSKLDAILSGQQEQGKRLDAIEQRNAQAETPPAETPKPTKETKPSLFEQAFASGPAVESGTDMVRVVNAHERYDATKSLQQFPAMTTKQQPHPYAGQRMFEGDPNGDRRYIDTASDLERAVAGAYIKWAIRSEKGGDAGIPQALRMTDHDRDLMQYALQEMKWGGVLHGVGSEGDGAIGVKNRKLTPGEIKAAIDDNTSGGLEIAPIAFDDMIIQVPILNGEIYPRVTTVNITRGRRIEGGSIGNVTFSSGGADATAIPLFNTANFIAAFDTTIFVANGSIEIGLDFLSDSPIDVAGVVSAQYGQQLLAWLDEQCAVGDGTTEPEGVTNATGTTTVNSTNGAGGPPTVGDYEGLLFGVAKNYKQGYATDRIAFAANETSYQRSRAIAVGATDERRVFGMTHEDYRLFQHPYAINEQFANTQITFTNWARYRMYRRLGLTIKVTTEGKELVRNNLMLMTARARYGGQMEDGAAAAVMADAQA